ncbi:unannotated protein [freshwater metagenome]|uniref:Unannotated protein n=1 Tax=freshwater metagenome TaxID=449393 RepID=A0A6J7KXT2_9ZZZZ
MRVVAGEWRRSGGHLGLSGAHLVVREGEIAATALHVDRRHEMIQSNGRAFDVPPGAPATERALPRWITRAFEKPQQAVEWVLLARAVGIASALGEDLDHPLRGETSDRSEPGVGVNPEVEVALEVVDGARRLKLVDVTDHRGDRLDGTDVVARRHHLQRGHVLTEELGLAVTQCHPVIASFEGAGEQRVVDISDVLDVMNLVPGIEPHPLHEIERDIGGGMPHMRGVVRRDPANVDLGDRSGSGEAYSACSSVVKRQRWPLPGQGRN